MRKPPQKFVGRDKRAAEVLVGKGYMQETPDGYRITKAGMQALEAAAPKKT